MASVPAPREGGRPELTPSDPSVRKREHVREVLDDHRPAAVDAGWADVGLVPRALPVGSPASVDLRTDFLGRTLAAPLVVAGMTGGFAGAERLNASLGQAAEHLGIAVGVGSQRAALLDPDLAPSFAAIRRHAPDALVIANVGAAQLVAQGTSSPLGPEGILRVLEMVRADALAIHLNFVQELVQSEGDRVFEGIPDAIAAVVRSSPVPVVVKETGAGLDRESAVALVELGVAALDVGGAGGTSFVRVEAARGGPRAGRLGQMLDGWGISTAASVLETRGLGVPVIATGGVRTGLDAVRALALGADLVGVGRPAIQAASIGTSAVVATLESLLDELRITLALAGAMRPRDLAAPVLSGATLEWARQRALI